MNMKLILDDSLQKNSFSTEINSVMYIEKWETLAEKTL